MTLTKEQMVIEAIKDFKKYGESKKCRHYLSLINGLRSIPCGVSNKNTLSEFYEFIPANERRGVTLEKAVQYALQFYLGYREAMQDEDLQKLLRKRYTKLYYERNKEKMKARERAKYHLDEKYRERKRKLDNERWALNYKEYKEKYVFGQLEWRERNKDRILAYQKEWTKQNQDSVRKWREENKQYLSQRAKERYAYYKSLKSE